MEELLNEVRDTGNPVIIAGDMNTAGSNSTPTSIENMLYKRYLGMSEEAVEQDDLCGHLGQFGTLCVKGTFCRSDQQTRH